MIGRHQPVGAGIRDGLPTQAAGSQIRAGTDHHRTTVILDPGMDPHAGDPPVFHTDIRHLCLLDGQVIGMLQHLPHAAAVLRLVRLSTQGMHRRPFGHVQHLGLDKGAVNILAHLAAQRIDLPDDMSLGASADIGIAGHERNTLHTDGKHDCLKPQSGTGQRGLAAGMTGAYHDNIIFL